ncbi:unnamed protein product [Caenorhabditis nigoni]
MLYSQRWRNEKDLFVVFVRFPIFNISICLTLLLLIWILKKILDASFRCCHLTNEKKWKIWLQIGYIGCMFLGILPRIQAISAGNGIIGFLFTITVSMVSAFGIILLYCFFLSPAKKSLKVFFKPGDYLLWFHLITQLVITIVNLTFGISTGSFKQIIMIIVCELAFCPTFCYFSLELSMIWRGDFEFENIENQREEMQKFNDLENGENSEKLKLECKICYLGYSNYRIPRMLKECGHTVCEKCVEKILEQAEQKLEFYCPFCQKTTVIQGSASDLPKNFAIIDIINNYLN